MSTLQQQVEQARQQLDRQSWLQQQLDMAAGTGENPLQRDVERARAYGTITQGPSTVWEKMWHGYPSHPDLGFKDLLGIEASERLWNRVRNLGTQARPETPGQWAQWGAGAGMNALETGLAAADWFGIGQAAAPAARRIGRAASDDFWRRMLDESGQVDGFHGTGKIFPEFSDEFIGTGEGGAALGHGHYISELDDVAQVYANQALNKPLNIKIDGEPLAKWAENLHPDYKYPLENIINDFYIVEGGDADRAIYKMLHTNPDEFYEFYGRENSQTLQDVAIDLIRNKRITWDKNDPVVYELKAFKGMTPADYTLLDLYDPVPKEQQQQIADQLNKEFNDIIERKAARYTPERYYGVPQEWTDWMRRDWEEMRRGFIREDVDKLTDKIRRLKQGHGFSEELRGMEAKGINLYRDLASLLGNKKEASQFLKRAGFSGTRAPTGQMAGFGESYIVRDTATGRPVPVPKRITKVLNAYRKMGPDEIEARIYQRQFEPYDMLPEDDMVWRDLQKGVQSGKYKVSRAKNYVIFDPKDITIEKIGGKPMQEIFPKKIANIDEPNAYAVENTIFAHPFVSQRIGRKMTEQEKLTRRLAYGVKSGDSAAIDAVAKDMAAKIPGDASKVILVPIPGHTGDTASARQIADAIARRTGAEVKDVLRRMPGPSQKTSRVMGRKTLKPSQFGVTVTEKLDPNRVYFIDNVISSGATMRSAMEAMGGGKGLVYAKSSPKPPLWGVAPLGVAPLFDEDEQ